MTSLLPAQFKELERFIDWSIPTMTGRMEKRVASDMGDVRAFYDAMLGRAEEALSYLNGFALSDLPEDASRLMDIMLSFAGIATCVEFYDSTSVPNGVPHARFPLVAPGDAH